MAETTHFVTEHFVKSVIVFSGENFLVEGLTFVSFQFLVGLQPWNETTLGFPGFDGKLLADLVALSLHP